MTVSLDGASGRPVKQRLLLETPLRILNAELVAMIDRSLVEVGGFGAVKVVVKDGRVRYVEVVRSVEVRG
ncbi:MAG: hypothetical protein HZY76_22745 [Anaerolineae bacterium]|nr:MAG: hypothetical protein HZY76_22745 [Anaerolineae bacterium]